MDNGTEPTSRVADDVASSAARPKRRRQWRPRRDVPAIRSADCREEVVHRQHVLGSREQGEADAARARADAQPHRVLRRRPRSDRERDRRTSRVSAARRPASSSPATCSSRWSWTTATFHLVKNTPKITGFLGGMKPTPVPEREITGVQHERGRGQGRQDQGPRRRSSRATRSASSMVRLRTSRPRSKKSRRTSRSSRSRCRCSAAPRRSSLTSPRSRKHKQRPSAPPDGP